MEKIDQVLSHLLTLALLLHCDPCMLSTPHRRRRYLHLLGGGGGVAGDTVHDRNTCGSIQVGTRIH